LTPFVLGINLDVVLFDDNEDEILKHFKFVGKDELKIKDTIFVINKKGHYEIVYSYQDVKNYNYIYKYYRQEIKPKYIKIDPALNNIYMNIKNSKDGANITNPSNLNSSSNTKNVSSLEKNNNNSNNKNISNSNGNVSSLSKSTNILNNNNSKNNNINNNNNHIQGQISNNNNLYKTTFINPNQNNIYFSQYNQKPQNNLYKSQIMNFNRYNISQINNNIYNK
jgi:hypothetical protein